MSSNRLLIIDDEPEIANLVAAVARSCGYDVRCTGDASEFRALHHEWHPTHVVLDLHMPGTDGIELIRHLAVEKSGARIMAMSGFDAKVVESAKRLGTERGLTMAGILLSHGLHGPLFGRRGRSRALLAKFRAELAANAPQLIGGSSARSAH